MRRLARGVIAAAALVSLTGAAAGCLGTGASAPSSTCENTKRPAVAMASRLASAPSEAKAECLARSQSAIFGTGQWGDATKQMLGVNPTLSLWQARSLLYACDGCRDAVFSSTWVRRNRPDWIMHSADGSEIHPIGRPNLLLLDFGNNNYQTEWVTQVVADLGHGGWTGVDVVDASNAPRWDGVPELTEADVATPPVGDEDEPKYEVGQPMTPEVQRAYLGTALEFVRAVVKTSAFRLAARNGPASIVDPGQINSTDLVGVGQGFALLTGSAWDQLFDYFHTAFQFRVGAIVWDDQTRLNRQQRVYGLASYYLVQDALSVYGVRDPLNPLYQLALGERTDGIPTQQGAAWVRDYPSGAVAVNPSATPQPVTFSGHPAMTLPPFSAVIWAGPHQTRSW